MILRPSHFQTDATSGQTLPGYTDGRDWNGWARPYFTHEVGFQIVEALLPLQNAYYDARADEFVFESPDGEEERFGAVEVDGEKLFPIGAGAWIWEVSP
jgi:hypothetical protein